jgi:hypothetical protein
LVLDKGEGEGTLTPSPSPSPWLTITNSFILIDDKGNCVDKSIKLELLKFCPILHGKLMMIILDLGVLNE